MCLRQRRDPMLSGRVQRCPAFSVFTNSRSISARDATLCKRNGPFQDRPARHVAHDPIGDIIVLRRNIDECPITDR
jgi:hypothetical protein